LFFWEGGFLGATDNWRKGRKKKKKKKKTKKKPKKKKKNKKKKKKILASFCNPRLRMSDVAPTDRQITLCRGQPLRVETTDPAVGRTLFLTRPAYLGDALARERPLASLITYALPRIDPAHDHDHHAVHIAHLESDKSAAGYDFFCFFVLNFQHD
jgi:ABC-type nickel/cobalt efflux system permease component RcnA